MSYGLTATINELITEIRDELDEPVDSQTNFWDDPYLLSRLNKGFRQVWQTARETKENWFTRVLRSDDAALTIYGRSYDPSALALTAGATEIILPPDFYEARSLESIAASDASVATVLFDWTDLGSETFRDGLRLASGTGTTAYSVDVRWGDGGPRLMLSPAVGTDAATTGVTLTYVYGPKSYLAGDSLENSGFSRVMLDAAVAYAAMEARRKENVPASIQVAQGAWGEKIGLVTRSSGPRQSQEPEVVEGYLEGDI